MFLKYDTICLEKELLKKGLKIFNNVQFFLLQIILKTYYLAHKKSKDHIKEAQKLFLIRFIPLGEPHV